MLPRSILPTSKSRACTHNLSLASVFEAILKMELQPTELLEQIFKQFSSLKEIQKCRQTSNRWKLIIEDLFEKNSKNILIKSLFIS